MQAVPTVIVLCLLAFFVSITAGLLALHWRQFQTRQRRRMLELSDRQFLSPVRRLTLQDGKVVPYEEAHNRINDQRHLSISAKSPRTSVREIPVDIEKGELSPFQHGQMEEHSLNSPRSLRSLQGPAWTPGRPPWLSKLQASAQDKSPHVTPSPSPTILTQCHLKSTESHASHGPRSCAVQTSAGHKHSRLSVSTFRPAIPPRLSSQPQPRGTSPGVSPQQTIPSMASIESDVSRRRSGADSSRAIVQRQDLRKSALKNARNSLLHWTIPAITGPSSAYKAPTIPDSAYRIESSRSVSESRHLSPSDMYAATAEAKSKRQSSLQLQTSLSQKEQRVRRSFLSMTPSPSTTSSSSSEHNLCGSRECRISLPRVSRRSGSPAMKDTRFAIAAAEENAHSRPNRISRSLVTTTQPASPCPISKEMIERVRIYGCNYNDRVTTAPIDRRLSPMTHSQPVSPLSPSFSLNSITASCKDGELDEDASSYSFDMVNQRDLASSSRQRCPLQIESNQSPSLGHINDDLLRGQSVRSNQSTKTVASSEISGVWTFGNAEIVKLYPDHRDEGHSDEIINLYAVSDPPSIREITTARVTTSDQQIRASLTPRSSIHTMIPASPDLAAPRSKSMSLTLQQKAPPYLHSRYSSTHGITSNLDSLQQINFRTNPQRFRNSTGGHIRCDKALPKLPSLKSGLFGDSISRQPSTTNIHTTDYGKVYNYNNNSIFANKTDKQVFANESAAESGVSRSSGSTAQENMVNRKRPYPKIHTGSDFGAQGSFYSASSACTPLSPASFHTAIGNHSSASSPGSATRHHTSTPFKASPLSRGPLTQFAIR